MGTRVKISSYLNENITFNEYFIKNTNLFHLMVNKFSLLILY